VAGLERIAAALRGKRALVTGHTGFKGGWLCQWLADLGADVTGYALPPETEPDLFSAIRLGEVVRSVHGDIRERARLDTVLRESRPEMVFHLAAQPLVRRSYRQPLETFAVNVMGTVQLLDAVRARGERCAVVVVTSDKCYQNDGSGTPHKETDALGGKDPYSASKAAAELVVGAYRSSFFPPSKLAEHGIALASVRAGNVIGGGDWGEDRLIPDGARAFGRGEPLRVRNPRMTRPFQHVIEPLAGYLLLAERLLGPDAPAACRAFNLGPAGATSVRTLVTEFAAAWGGGVRWEEIPDPEAPAEAPALALDPSDAGQVLGWRPRWTSSDAARRSAIWYRAHAEGAAPPTLRDLFRRDMADWFST